MENKSELARRMGVSRRSLYYRSTQEAKDWYTKQLIEVALRDHPAYGHKRLAMQLNINKKRVLRVMKKMGSNPIAGIPKSMKSDLKTRYFLTCFSSKYQRVVVISGRVTSPIW